MLQFMKELGKVQSNLEGPFYLQGFIFLKHACFLIWFWLYCFVYLQAVTIGVVGGSDLVKISEQLGQTGYLQLEL